MNDQTVHKPTITLFHSMRGLAEEVEVTTSDTASTTTTTEIAESVTTTTGAAAQGEIIAPSQNNNNNDNNNNNNSKSKRDVSYSFTSIFRRAPSGPRNDMIAAGGRSHNNQSGKIFASAGGEQPDLPQSYSPMSLFDSTSEDSEYDDDDIDALFLHRRHFHPLWHRSRFLVTEHQNGRVGGGDDFDDYHQTRREHATAAAATAAAPPASSSHHHHHNSDNRYPVSAETIGVNRRAGAEHECEVRDRAPQDYQTLQRSVPLVPDAIELTNMEAAYGGEEDDDGDDELTVGTDISEVSADISGTNRGFYHIHMENGKAVLHRRGMGGHNDDDLSSEATPEVFVVMCNTEEDYHRYYHHQQHNYDSGEHRQSDGSDHAAVASASAEKGSVAPRSVFSQRQSFKTLPLHEFKALLPPPNMDDTSGSDTTSNASSCAEDHQDRYRTPRESGEEYRVPPPLESVARRTNKVSYFNDNSSNEIDIPNNPSTNTKSVVDGTGPDSPTFSPMSPTSSIGKFVSMSTSRLISSPPSLRRVTNGRNASFLEDGSSVAGGSTAEREYVREFRSSGSSESLCDRREPFASTSNKRISVPAKFEKTSRRSLFKAEKVKPFYFWSMEKVVTGKSNASSSDSTCAPKWSTSCIWKQPSGLKLTDAEKVSEIVDRLIGTRCASPPRAKRGPGALTPWHSSLFITNQGGVVGAGSGGGNNVCRPKKMAATTSNGGDERGNCFSSFRLSQVTMGYAHAQPPVVLARM